MPTHDIIDNREEVLLEHVKNLLRNSVSAKFAVGYFFTTGLQPLMEEIQNLNELKILIGNVSSKRTIEQLAEAHMNLLSAKQKHREQMFMNPSKRKQAVSETKNGIRTYLSLIDESHNFRYPNTDRYKKLQPYLYGKKTILVTATPRNNTPEDIYHQIKLFHHDEETIIPIEPSNLKRFFKEVEIGNRRIQELLMRKLTGWFMICTG